MKIAVRVNNLKEFKQLKRIAGADCELYIEGKASEHSLNDNNTSRWPLYISIIDCAGSTLCWGYMQGNNHGRDYYLHHGYLVFESLPAIPKPKIQVAGCTAAISTKGEAVVVNGSRILFEEVEALYEAMKEQR